MYSRIYTGKVFHKRFKPKIHNLNYSVFSFLISLNEIDELDQNLKLFSYNKFNIFSFWDKDYGEKKDCNLNSYIKKILKKSGIDIQGGRIMLLCYPRLWGYVFNPLNVYYCYNNYNNIVAIIYEVSNTFKQSHSYIIKNNHINKKDYLIAQSCKKRFFVSPFMEMSTKYNFEIKPPGKSISVLITQKDDEGILLKAKFLGKSKKLNDLTLFYLLIKYPFMTLKVIMGIHWEALKLWCKGLNLVKRPPAPKKAFTFVSSETLEKTIERH